MNLLNGIVRMLFLGNFHVGIKSGTDVKREKRGESGIDTFQNIEGNWERIHSTRKKQTDMFGIPVPNEYSDTDMNLTPSSHYSIMFFVKGGGFLG